MIDLINKEGDNMGGKALREKMSAIENETLIAAFIKSNKTLEEAIAFFESDMKEDSTPKPIKRRGRKRKNTVG